MEMWKSLKDLLHIEISPEGLVTAEVQRCLGQWFEVIGVAPISTLPFQQKFFPHAGLLPGLGEAESCQPRLLRRGSDKNSTGLWINANSENMKTHHPTLCRQAHMLTPKNWGDFTHLLSTVFVNVCDIDGFFQRWCKLIQFLNPGWKNLAVAAVFSKTIPTSVNSKSFELT